MVSVVDRVPSQRNLYVWITLSRRENTSSSRRCWIGHVCWNMLLLLLVIQIYSHSAVIVLGLQVYGPNHINPDQTLLRSALWQLSELTGRGSNTWVIRQRVHFEWTLQVSKHMYILRTGLGPELNLVSFNFDRCWSSVCALNCFNLPSTLQPQWGHHPQFQSCLAAVWKCCRNQSGPWTLGHSPVRIHTPENMQSYWGHLQLRKKSKWLNIVKCVV